MCTLDHRCRHYYNGPTPPPLHTRPSLPLRRTPAVPPNAPAAAAAPVAVKSSPPSDPLLPCRRHHRHPLRYRRRRRSRRPKYTLHNYTIAVAAAGGR